MPVFPLIANGLKLFLVLGVGLGGHHIYEVVSAGKLIDDGSFYHIEKMSNNSQGKFDQKNNKVYQLPSAIKEEDQYFNNSDLKERHIEHWDFNKDWGFTNRIKVLKEGNYKLESHIYKMIKDHTLKLVMPCQSGTGWLLDFEIPEDKEKYPTRWFIATNLHVINKFVFSDNPYKTSLPITETSRWSYLPRFINYGIGGVNSLDTCQTSLYNKKSDLNLYTEEDLEDRDSSDNFRNFSHFTNNFFSWSDLLGWNNPWVQKHNFYQRPRIYTTTVKDPKLVFSAVNFLGPRYTVSGHSINNENYFKDFGVIEIKFENEDQARTMTNKVYEKYYKNKVKNIPVTLDNPVNKVNSINFFAPELMSKYSPEELAKFKDNFFMGGYPGSVADNLSFSMNQKFKVVRQNDRNYYGYGTIEAVPTYSKLTYFKKDRNIWNILNSNFNYNLKNSAGGIIPGHADLEAIDRSSDSSKIEWNGRKLKSWGYNYLINNSFLGSGASGSMVLDESGALLGLYRMFNPGYNFGFVEPVRGNWVVDNKGKVILPGFDLIAGTGNSISYRSQIEKIKPYMNTYLKSQNWAFK